MQTLIYLLFRTASVVFGLFDVFGVLWASGLAKSWLELLWWWTPAISLVLGGVLPRNVIDMLQFRLFLILLAVLGLLYSLYRIDVSWNSPGIDSTNNVIRFLLMVFVMSRFGAPFFSKSRKEGGRHGS